MNSAWHSSSRRLSLEPILAKIRELTGELAEHTDGDTFRSLFKDPNSVVSNALRTKASNSRRECPTLKALAGDHIGKRRAADGTVFGERSLELG